MCFNPSSRRPTVRLHNKCQLVNTKTMEKELYFNQDGSATKKLKVREKGIFKGRFSTQNFIAVDLLLSIYIWC